LSGSIDDQSIGINSLYAKALGLEDNLLVALSEVPKPPTIQSATVRALTENDHYVLVIYLLGLEQLYYNRLVGIVSRKCSIHSS
jgi:hypothetical protein